MAMRSGTSRSSACVDPSAAGKSAGRRGDARHISSGCFTCKHPRKERCRHGDPAAGLRRGGAVRGWEQASARAGDRPRPFLRAFRRGGRVGGTMRPGCQRRNWWKGQLGSRARPRRAAPARGAAAWRGRAPRSPSTAGGGGDLRMDAQTGRRSGHRCPAGPEALHALLPAGAPEGRLDRLVERVCGPRGCRCGSTRPGGPAPRDVARSSPAHVPRCEPDRHAWAAVDSRLSPGAG